MGQQEVLTRSDTIRTFTDQNRRVDSWLAETGNGSLYSLGAICTKTNSCQMDSGGGLQETTSHVKQPPPVTRDLVTGVPVSESRRDSVIVCVDKPSKMVCLAYCNTTDRALEVAHYIIENMSPGLPQVLVSDRNPRSRSSSNLYTQICSAQMLKCKHVCTGTVFCCPSSDR